MGFIMQSSKILNRKVKLFTSSLLLMLITFTYAQAPSGYYESTDGLLSYELKTVLKIIIDDIGDGNGFPSHQDQGYGALYDAYAAENSGDSDDYFENDGTVLDMYSERSLGIDNYNYEHFENNCGNYSDEGDCYNREHLVPQSTFNSASPMKNDYFHVVPSDGAVNGARGSFPFGEVTNPNYTSTNGSKRGSNTFPGYTGIVFEPIDEFKGDIARAVLYFAIRYEDEFSSSWRTNEVLADNPQDFFVDWYLALLLSWHLNDPVSEREIDRNNNGYQFQSNRNPLIDRPEFAVMIWGDFTDNEPPSAPSDLQANNTTNSSLQLSWTSSEDNVAVAQYIIEQDNVDIGSVGSNQSTYLVTGLNAETLYNFRLYAVDQGGNISEPSDNLDVLTLSEPSYLISEDFENCSTALDNFTAISEISALDWRCISDDGENNSQGYQMNAFQNGQIPSLDWLITSNKINFDEFELEKISFFASANFGNTKLELLFSSSYTGNGNPSNFNWQEVPNVEVPLHPNGSGSLFTYNAESIDISELPENAYIAFRYNTTNGQLATRWTIDNFRITGEQVLSSSSFSNTLEVKLYPNPLKNSHIHLNFNSSDRKRIELYDLNGKILLTKHSKQNYFKEDLGWLTPGIYFFKIYQHGNSVIKKLVKK
ncbi:secreted endonuclease I [Psychroflexus gondwanensis ACAM 44]|uniref:Secreted endonuclease I n=1 Tax=Psychroflexus gondwanensis ACAM 44 TaxID=1189619 RepID=N1WYC3_9FLAO|nr:secreted endonuclease I [Psychroflexus gondwanensis ACAM 44]